MSRRRTRILFVAVMSSALLAGLAVAESAAQQPRHRSSDGLDTIGGSSEVISDTVAESEVARTTGTVAETSVVTTPEAAAVEILPPDEPWAGLTRSEWEVRAWQWVASMPEDVSPWRDTTGERCGYGQSGPVFFLTGAAAGEITCVVAEGTAILVSSIGTECSTAEPPPWFGRTEDELRACASAAMDPYTDVHASINGQEVVDLGSYRLSSPLFTLTFPENNVFEAEPGVAQSVADSYSFIIAPPPPGEYEISTSAMHPDTPEPWAMTVNLVVEAPQVIERHRRPERTRSGGLAAAVGDRAVPRQICRSVASRGTAPPPCRCGAGRCWVAGPSALVNSDRRMVMLDHRSAPLDQVGRPAPRRGSRRAARPVEPTRRRAVSVYLGRGTATFRHR